MGDPADKPAPEGDKQRDALAESEKQAHQTQPENWKDEAITDKVVEIQPDGKHGSIKGLDPKK